MLSSGLIMKGKTVLECLGHFKLITYTIFGHMDNDSMQLVFMTPVPTCPEKVDLGTKNQPNIALHQIFTVISYR